MGTFTITLAELAEALGVSRSHCYAMAKLNALPVPVIRVGPRRMVVARHAVEDILGPLDDAANPAGASLN